MESPTNSNADLSAKYNKLASEYSKLRSQFNILKNALIKEQKSLNETKEELRDNLVSMRKREDEMESIKFRNQQLTRRIGVLQDEILALESQSKSKKGQKSDHNSAKSNEIDVKSSEHLNSVMGLELQGKIDENARLHARLAEVDSKYEDVILGLNSKVKELEAEVRKQSQNERAQDSRQKDLIQGLKEEKNELLDKIASLETELTDQRDKVTVLQVQLESANFSPENRKISVPKSQNSGRTGVVLSHKDVRIQSVELLSQFSEPLSDLVAAWSDYHTYWEHRLKDTHLEGPLTDNAARLSQQLLQNLKHLKPIEESFQNLLSNALTSKSGNSSILSQISNLGKSVKKYVDYSAATEGLTIACLQHESNQPSCPPSQQAKNSQYSSALRSYHRTLVRMADYLILMSKGDIEDAIENLENLNVVISQLYQNTSELSQIYGAKASAEEQLPTVTDQLKNTNMCIVAALGSLVGALNNLSRLLSDQQPRISSLIKATRDLGPEEMEEEETPKSQEKSSDISQDSQGENFSSPFKAFRNNPELGQEIDLLRQEKQNLIDTLNSMQDKLKNLEREREKSRLDFKLLEMKLEKLRRSNSDDRLNDNADGPNDTADNGSDAVHKPFEERIEELVSEKLLADSKATSFHLECLNLKQRIVASEWKIQKLQEDLLNSKTESALLRDESGAISMNYESQLQMMTEHVANMNEKLTSKSEEIEHLKYELKGGKKK